MPTLLTHLLAEKRDRRKGGLYHKTQVNFAYNSNRIEGSKLVESQTRSIFETRTIGLGFKGQKAVPVDDIIATSNHFVAFDCLLEYAAHNVPLTTDTMMEFQLLLKASTPNNGLEGWSNVGKGWKKEKVGAEINKLNAWYNSLSPVTFEHIIEYHHRFEKIHPFQDGNGRVGRLIAFRECLRHNIIPFVIDDNHKRFYYRGLREFSTMREYLIDTCLSAQDVYASWIRYFYPDMFKPHKKAKAASAKK